MTNRLSRETSPYLRQHQHNPVDWYAWGDEALERARREDKPILLSIGYSACHWCHVMERESFENPMVASRMNDSFVCIKVDREERPDLDQLYQNVAQAITHGGGWPLTVFLTPDLKPFFGGTYFPPEDRYGRPGFPRLLEALSEAYRSDRGSVAGNAEKLDEFIRAQESVMKVAPGAPTLEQLADAAESLAAECDEENGGFGSAPKFPNVPALTFLWRMSRARGSATGKRAALLALEKMARGGIFDQLGGGFHRYSVDATWSVPHFEKMLYDNALLLRLYSEVLLSGDLFVAEDLEALFLSTIEETVEYLLREMRSPEGGFYAAQDADSEGEEGKFFVWKPEELSAVLTEAEARVAALRFGVTPAGNFEHSGATVLFLARELEEVAREAGVDAGEAARLLGSAKTKLLAARAKRVRPGLDDKILASWNGLAISGLCWASKALARFARKELAARALDAARGAFALATGRLSSEGNRLFATFQGGEGKLNAYLDDYAFLAMGALDLARATPDGREASAALERAGAWTRVILTRFSDSEGAGFYFTSDDHERLLARPKTLFDQAIPSGAAVTLECLVALAELAPVVGADAAASEAAARLAAVFPLAARQPFGCGQTLCAALLGCLGPVAVSGAGAEAACLDPHVFRKPGESPSGASPDALVVCHRQACGLPHRDVDSARAEAQRKAGTSVAIA
jgi:uncharacterized protein YyaL (SSP411 family)